MVIPGIEKYSVILASRSPRRQQLLKELGVNFAVREVDFDESYPDVLRGKEIACYLSEKKAEPFRKTISPTELVITADTIVWINGKVLGKPSDTDEAVFMIRELSGAVHEVITGVTLLSSIAEKTFCVSTRVTFSRLSENEIRYYAETFRPFDKAGAYGIQEWIGLAACSKINGSYYNVVGLPSERLYAELKKFVLRK